VGEPLLAVRAVSRVYGAGPSQVQALRGLSFQVEAGEIVAITGSSGSGKSTLLNLLGFLDSPTEGEVVVGGVGSGTLRPWETAAVRNTYIGFVFQQFHLLATSTAIDNIGLPLVYRRVTAERRHELARAAMRRVGLAGMEQRRPGQMSGGQQQRVAIARALVTRPRVVLCDEPTGNLDSRTGQELLDLLLEIPDDERAVVLVTHDEALAARATRRLHLVDGRIHGEHA
jgi:putative ABC transport system ATP-binding protein